MTVQRKAPIDNPAGVEDSEEVRKKIDRDDQQNLNQGMDTGTHSTSKQGVNWGPSYQGKFVPEKKKQDSEKKREE